MATFKFGDKVKTTDGRDAVVQEDQENGTNEVKVIFEGEDVAHILEQSTLTKVN